MDLDALRHEIDLIDAEIVRLLTRRFTCAQALAAEKERASLPAIDLKREAAVIDHVRGLASPPLTPQSVERLYRLVIELTRQVAQT